jgi:hypothetical protein
LTTPGRALGFRQIYGIRGLAHAGSSTWAGGRLRADPPRPPSPRNSAMTRH